MSQNKKRKREIDAERNQSIVIINKEYGDDLSMRQVFILPDEKRIHQVLNGYLHRGRLEFAFKVIGLLNLSDNDWNGKGPFIVDTDNDPINRFELLDECIPGVSEMENHEKKVERLKVHHEMTKGWRCVDVYELSKYTPIGTLVVVCSPI